MNYFHKSLNRMAFFTMLLVIFVLFFWHNFMNIAISNLYLNGIIIGTTLFGFVLCFYQIFQLSPEYKWFHNYVTAKYPNLIIPKLLKPVALALNNKHTHLNSNSFSNIIDMISLRMEDNRESIRYVTNTLIFLGLLGTFWGLILTVGGFADLIGGLNFTDETVISNMQQGLVKPLFGMSTAFTSSLLGLSGSLAVSFLGLQIQSAQNKLFHELEEFLASYMLEKNISNEEYALGHTAPVQETIYHTISDMYYILKKHKYDVQDMIKIDNKYPAIIALGSNETLIIGTTEVPSNVILNMLKRFNLCFADTLNNISINIQVLCITSSNDDFGPNTHIFRSANDLNKYMSKHINQRSLTTEDKDTFNAYADYIKTVVDYLFKPKP